jgi:hypothetical protein
MVYHVKVRRLGQERRGFENPRKNLAVADFNSI